VVADLPEDRRLDWVSHVAQALPDLREITTIERPEDRHRYLVLKYKTGLEAPSWLVSDGTLRLLALTLLAYLPKLEGIYLVEEPENGIHPRAVEIALQSLASVYDAQVLMATHSPVVLSLARPEQLLCFARTPEGETDVVLGSEHPRLQAWQRETDLGTLFASGILG
jgi:predicted ATPase